MKSKCKKIVGSAVFWLGLCGCGDVVDQSNADPAGLGLAVQKLKLCQDIKDEKVALEIAHYSEDTIDRKSKFPCSNTTDLWTPKNHQAMKDVGFHFANFKARNYKPNANQQRLEIIFTYQDNYGVSKPLSYSCEMSDKTKEWVAKDGSPEC